MRIPQQLRSQRRWLVWRHESGRKVPYYASTHRRRNGAMETADDLNQLSEYDEAVRALSQAPAHTPYSGLGFAITPGHILIDFDDVLSDGAIADPWVSQFITEAKAVGAFIEISQSGRGIHVIGTGTGIKCGHKNVGIEIYTEKRFVAITGQPFGDATAEQLGDCSGLAATARAEYVARVQAKRNAEERSISVDVQAAAIVESSDITEQLTNLLRAFDADDREQWVKIGLALGRAYPENRGVFDAYVAWAQTSDKYTGAADDRAMEDIFFRQSVQPAATKYTIDSMLEQLCAVLPERGFKRALPALFADAFGELVAEEMQLQARIVFAWDSHALTEQELDNRPPSKRFIIDRILPAARTAMIGRGGLGKTMLLLYEALHVAAGRRLHGQFDVLEPGRVLIVTAEEERALLIRRSASLLDRLEWPESVKRNAFTNIAIQDVSSRVPRLIGQGKGGEFHVTPWADRLIEGYQQADIRWAIFDPISAFGMNENAMNDSAVVIMEAATRISDGLGGAAVTLVHHTSKEGARNNIADAHSGRGGSAFGDASRATRVLTARTNLPAGLTAYDPMTRTARLTLHHVKNSYAAPVEPLDLDVVDGYDIRVAEPDAGEQDADAAFWTRVEQIIAQEETLTGNAPSIEVLTRYGGFHLSRQAVRQRLMDGVAIGRIVMTAHPTDKRKRGVKLASDWGGF